MDVNTTLQTSRDLAGVTIQQYPNATLLPWANIVYHVAIRYLLKDVAENLNVITQQIDAAVVNSYTLATDILTIKQVRVKTTPTDTFFTPSKEIDFFDQPFTRDYYLVNQSIMFPRHQVVKGQLFIAPAFTASTAGAVGNKQIEVEYDQRPSDLVVGGAESTIIIPTDYHHVIAHGVRMFIEANLKVRSGERASIGDYQSMIVQMIDQVTNFDDSNMEINMPDTSNIE